jgi:nucleoside-diphosphate-sugar epimerase
MPGARSALRGARARVAGLFAPSGPLPGIGDGRDHVLVTGAAGSIGSILVEALAGDYVVHGLDVARGPGVERVVDVTRSSRVEPAFEGMRAVVDLAADSSVSATWDSVLTNNVPATVNVLEAARKAGVRRVVFASSNHVVGMYERDEPYASIVAGVYEGLDPDELPRLGTDVPVRPDGPYGIGKALGEAAARYYSEAFGLSVICLRIGTVNRANRPTGARHFATLLTHRDLVHLVRCCLEAPDSLRFAVFYGVSANTWRFWDIEGARRMIGYAPEDDAESRR